jgi:hypothetical protein
MKKLITLIILSAFGTIAYTQVVDSSCEAPQDIVNVYSDDADELAIRWSLAAATPWADSVHIDPVLRERILGSLLAVFNATSLPARDSVTVCYNIHTWPVPAMNSVIVSVDSSEAWVQQVAIGEYPTDNDAFNALYDEYGLSYGEYYDWSFGHAFVLNSPANLNLEALSILLEEIPGVFYADINGMFGDGNDIQVEMMDSDVILEYEMAWGDCFAGCMMHHYWKFRVEEDCSVEFVTSWGDEVDTPCALSVVEDPSCTPLLFPNPAIDVLNIRSCGKGGIATIYNSLGALVYSGRMTKGAVDISTLPPGLYFFSDAGNGTTAVPFIKE